MVNRLFCFSVKITDENMGSAQQFLVSKKMIRFNVILFNNDCVTLQIEKEFPKFTIK